MDSSRKSSLEAAGWRVGDADEFLGLTAAESQMVTIRLALSDELRHIRRTHHWTQTQVAQRIGSSQSRVAKMEAADGSVSVDLIVKTLLALGASSHDVGEAISRSGEGPPRVPHAG